MDVNRKLNGQLVFSTSGQLLFTMDNKNLVPLSLMAKIQDEKNKDLFILRYMESEVDFEEGITVADFFIALTPWANVLSIYTDRDFDSYIKASRTPTQVKPSKDDDFKTISLSRRSTLSRHVDIVFDDSEKTDDMESFFNRDYEKIKTNKFSMDSHISALGKTDKGDEYSIMTNFDDVKYVPIIVNESEEISLSEDFSTVPDVIENNGHFNIIRHSEDKFTLREVIQAIVVDGLFFKTVKGLENFSKEMSEDMADMADMADMDEGVYEDDTDTGTSPGDDDDNDSNNEGEDRKIKIVVKEGAFDGFFEGLETDDNVWSFILKKSAQDKDNIPRIGQIKLSKED